MCLNCGCGIPNGDMGSKDVITLDKLRKAAKAGGNNNIQDLMAKLNQTYEAKVKGTPEDTKPVK